MKLNRSFFSVAFIALFAFLLSACAAAPATNWPGVAAQGDLIYLANGTHVYAVQASNGSDATANLAGKVSPLRFPLEADGKMSFYATPALTADGLLLIGSAASGAHGFYAAEAATGSIKWTFEGTKPWLAGALVLGDSIFAPAGDGKLYAFHTSGEKIWEQALSEHALWTTPVTDGTNLYVATLNHEIYCLAPDSGKILWKVELDNGIIGHPALLDGVLYVGTLSGNLYALNTTAGAELWKTQLDGNIWGTPGVNAENKALYIGTVFGTAGKFYALNLENGQVIWSKDDEGSIIAGPLVTPDQVIYVTETGRVQSLDQNGAPKWQADFPKNKLYTPPLLVGDSIIVTPMGSEFLMAAYTLGGAQKWTFTPAK